MSELLQYEPEKTQVKMLTDTIINEEIITETQEIQQQLQNYYLGVVHIPINDMMERINDLL